MPTTNVANKHSHIVLRKKFALKARDFEIPLGESTKMMGVLNLTPDSFSGDGLLIGRKFSLEKAVELAHQFVREGADIIDVGGESSRPGSKTISQEEEIKRIIPTVKKLCRELRIPVSVDTHKQDVARSALDSGASIINNIMGTKVNKTFLTTVKNYHAAIVLMHIRGIPKTMQKRIRYRDLISEIMRELQESIEKCLEIGIKSDKIIIDPGIGFGKTYRHNLEIIHKLSVFKRLNKPILIGTSRKSFIGNALKREVSQRLMGTAATVAASVLNGAHIVRVHDIAAIKDVVDMTDAIINIK